MKRLLGRISGLVATLALVFAAYVAFKRLAGGATGAECTTSLGCADLSAACVSDRGARYCTQPCDSVRTCPVGWRCVPGQLESLLGGARDARICARLAADDRAPAPEATPAATAPAPARRTGARRSR